MSWIDGVVIFLLSVAFIYYRYSERKKSQKKAAAATSFLKRSLSDEILTSLADTKVVSGSSRSLISKMLSQKKRVVALYGSQTGTAEDYATRLCKELQQVGISAFAADLDDFDYDDLVNFPKDMLIIFMLATYGEGEPTDNAQNFYKWLTEGSVESSLDSASDKGALLSNLHFAMFGLGNRTYEHFNEVAKRVNAKLLELQAKRIGDLGLGDDDKSLEEDFLQWKEASWPEICQFLGADENASVLGSVRSFSLIEYNTENQPPLETIYVGEIGLLKKKAMERTRKVYDLKNPFYSSISSYRALQKGGDRTIMHITLSLTNSNMKYQSGDHVAVFPKNDMSLVQRLADRLGVKDLDALFSLNALEASASKKHPFPSPCSYRTALAYYVDITSPPKGNILRTMAEYADDAASKALFLRLSTFSGKDEYQSYILNAGRTLLDVLNEHPSVKLPIDHLLELLPRLQCRYYSISSSPRLHPEEVAITAVHLRYQTPLSMERKGVATDWLYQLATSPGSVGPIDVPIYVRRSNFKLPRNVSRPIVMIGPGTGVAPFIGFLEEREFHMKKGVEMGAAYLFYGCRKSQEDYIYEAELASYLASGALTGLFTAFSRDQEHKVYVQNLMASNAALLFDVIDRQNGCIYVCGDARNMARDVNREWIDILAQHGKISVEDATAYVKKLRASGRYVEDVWS